MLKATLKTEHDRLKAKYFSIQKENKQLKDVITEQRNTIFSLTKQLNEKPLFP